MDVIKPYLNLASRRSFVFIKGDFTYILFAPYILCEPSTARTRTDVRIFGHSTCLVVLKDHTPKIPYSVHQVYIVF